jgi:hypothetical protein
LGDDHDSEQCKIAADEAASSKKFRFAESRCMVAIVTELPMKTSMNHARRRALWVLRRAARAQTPGAARSSLVATTIEQLKSSGRPLLFSLLPRMLRADGRTADTLRNQFRYIENNKASTPAVTVSRWRWNRTLAMSRRIARRRR